MGLNEARNPLVYLLNVIVMLAALENSFQNVFVFKTLQSKHTINLIQEKELISYTFHFSQSIFKMQYFFLLILVLTLMSALVSCCTAMTFFGKNCRLNEYK